jgi:hypothetical protein
MLHKTTLLASGALTALMFTPAASYAEAYYKYTPSSPGYSQDRVRGERGERWESDSSRKAAKRACKGEIRDQIWSDKRHVEKVKFNGGSFDTRNVSNGKTKVSGQGQLLTGNNRWVNFNFNCMYDSYSNRILRASYRKTSDNRNQPDFNRETRQACSREIFRHILQNHGSAKHIEFNDQNLRRWRESRAETGLSGRGRFEGGRGRTRHFEFSCIYNHRQGYTRNAWVTVR